MKLIIIISIPFIIVFIIQPIRAYLHILAPHTSKIKMIAAHHTIHQIKRSATTSIHLHHPLPSGTVYMRFHCLCIDYKHHPPVHVRNRHI